MLIQGRGTVKRVQADSGDARHPPGMEVQFTPLDERSATLVDFMMATRAGLTENVGAGAAPLVRAVVPPKPKPVDAGAVVPKCASRSRDRRSREDRDDAAGDDDAGSDQARDAAAACRRCRR